MRIFKRYKGGILIEFTLSIPVCISLLFFVSDHYRFYELKNKLKSSAYLTASMLQHVTNNRPNKQLTIKDIHKITYASCLNFFHTNTMFNPWPFGIIYIAHFHYVKRLSSDSYQFQKTYAGTDRGTSPNNMDKSGVGTSTKTQAYVESLHPDLICQKDGEERVLIECVYRKASKFNKSKLGFFIMNPPNARSTDGYSNICIYKLVITPKPGLFPVKN